MKVDIWNILNVAEVDSLLEIQFKLVLLWKDPRLMFRNLKHSMHLNTAGETKEPRKDIWYPRIVFYNTKNRDESKVLQMKRPMT